MDANTATWRRCLAVNGLRVVLLMLFFITPSLSSARPPGRNDANRFIGFVVAERNSVGYEQQQCAVNHSDRLPAKFAAFNPILLYQSVRVFENVTCDLEADPMLSLVGPILGNVPFEPYHAMPLL
jgi:hypothetical protein